MANLICVYCLVVSPVLWFTGEILDCLSFDVEKNYFPGIEVTLSIADSVIGIAVMLLLIWGGIQLRSLTGKNMVLIGFWMKLSCAILFFLLFAALGVASGIAKAGDETQATTAFTTVEMIGFLWLPVYLLELAFVVISLVWLTRAHLALSRESI